MEIKPIRPFRPCIAIAVPQYNDALTILVDLIANYDQASEDQYASSIQTFDQTQTAILVITLLACVVSVGVAFVVSRSISTTARHLKTIATGISRGELEHGVIIQSGDEMGEIAAAFEQIIIYLRHDGRDRPKNRHRRPDAMT